MSDNNPPQEETTEETTIDYQRIRQKVKSGEYFRESRLAYNSHYLDPLADRYTYIIICGLAIAIFFMAVIGIFSMLPLKDSVPFIYYSEDLIEEIPELNKISREDEMPDDAIQRFLSSEYVKRRETYEIDEFDRYERAVRNQSTEEVFRRWQQSIDPRNADSPIAKYQRQNRRKINIINSLKRSENTVEVYYEALLLGDEDILKSYWIALVTYDYHTVETNEKTGETSPLMYKVTNYKTRKVSE